MLRYIALKQTPCAKLFNTVRRNNPCFFMLLHLPSPVQQLKTKVLTVGKFILKKKKCKFDIRSSMRAAAFRNNFTIS